MSSHEAAVVLPLGQYNQKPPKIKTPSPHNSKGYPTPQREGKVSTISSWEMNELTQTLSYCVCFPNAYTIKYNELSMEHSWFSPFITKTAVCGNRNLVCLNGLLISCFNVHLFLKDSWDLSAIYFDDLET